MPKRGNAWTKKQIKINNRRNEFLTLSEQGLLFCERYDFFLNKRELTSHKCYTGDNGNRVCPRIRILNEDGTIVRYNGSHKKCYNNNK